MRLLLLLLLLFSASYALDFLKDHTCTFDSDCNEPYETCEEGECEHKGPFPLSSKEGMGIGILSVIAMLCSAAGIGGSEIMIPLIKYFFGFRSTYAIPLAQVCIFASCLT